MSHEFYASKTQRYRVEAAGKTGIVSGHSAGDGAPVESAATTEAAPVAVNVANSAARLAHNARQVLVFAHMIAALLVYMISVKIPPRGKEHAVA
jgi:hypothetical protein